MKRTRLFAGLGLAACAAALAGCSTTPSGSAAADAPVVALGVFGPDGTERGATSDGGFRFGAGDALGRQIFTHYVASIRATPVETYATGSAQYPQ